MKATIWKVVYGVGTRKPWWIFSIRRGDKIPLVLSQQDFEYLFPSIPPESIPEAPETLEIEIKAKYAPKI